MAKTEKIDIDNTGVDKLEHFLQNNIKKIIVLISVLIIGFITAYIIYSVYTSSQNKKIDSVGAAELTLTDIGAVRKFINFENTVPFMKNYIALRSAGMFYLFGDNASAIDQLKNSGGEFKELSYGMLYDLGASKEIQPYLQGDMRELWYYRQVLSSSGNDIVKNIELFKSLYPDSPLLTLVENWNIEQ